jgi:hypothetical protein
VGQYDRVARDLVLAQHLSFCEVAMTARMKALGSAREAEIAGSGCIPAIGDSRPAGCESRFPSSRIA